MNTDLFGNEIKRKDTKTEYYLRNKDEITFSRRVARLEYLHKLVPEGIVLAGNMELVLSYRELQEVFVNGHYLSVILLGQSWIEKNLHIYLTEMGHGKLAQKGSKTMIDYCVNNKLVNKVLTNKMEKFRLIRNPIAHIKSIDYKYCLDKRAWSNRKNPLVQLEEDAKEIIEMSSHIAKYGLKP